MNSDNFCLKCMSQLQPGNPNCPVCGFSILTYVQKPNTLPVPSMLRGRYMTGIPLGVGGFGITYTALDLQIGGICAIKECMPNNVAYRLPGNINVFVHSEKTDAYQYGLQRFAEEAQLLCSLKGCANIISVYDAFYENNTAYYVMEYLDGCDLITATDGFKVRIPFEQVLSYFKQALIGLRGIHAKGIIHRDISPDNLYVTKNGNLKIIDFGSARYEMTQKNRELSVLVKYGYAPKEQYGSQTKQGPWTDIYALCASFYHITTGVEPQEALDRMAHDNIVYIGSLNAQLPPYFCGIITKGMAVEPTERFGSVDEILAILEYNNPVKQPATPKNQKQYNNTSTAKASQQQAEQKQNEARQNPGQNTYVQNPEAERVEIKYVPRGYTLTSEGLRPNTQTGTKVSVGREIGALMFDEFLYSASGAVIVVILAALIGLPTELSVIIGVVGSAVLWFFLNVYLETSETAATFGERILGLRVVSTYNSAGVPVIDCRKRNLAKCLGLFVFLFKQNGDCLHERVSNTKLRNR